MSVYLAQLRKDIGATWPLLALWTGGLVLLAVLHFRPVAGLPTGLSLYASWAFELLPILITAVVILQEPVADSDAFWLTRPLPLTALLGSKLTLIALLLVAPALLLQALSYARLDLPSPGLTSVTAQTALWLLPLVLFAWLLAAISRSLPNFVIWLAAASLLGTLLLVIANPLLQVMPSVGSRYGTHITVVGLEIGLLAIIWRYRTRRLPAFLILTLAALLLLRIGSVASAWTGASVDDIPEGNFKLMRIEHPTSGGPSADYVNVGAKLVAPGSDDAETMLYEAHVALRFSDGRVFESAPRIEAGYSSRGAAASNLAPLPRPTYRLPAMLSIPAADFADYAEQRGELTLRLSGQWKSAVHADIPAGAGQTWIDRNGRNFVRELRLESAQLVLVVDELRVGQRTGGSLDAIIYHPERREILSGGTLLSSNTGQRARPLVLSHPPSETRTSELVRRYDVNRGYSHRTADGYRFFAGPVDAAWLEGARLRVSTSPYLGPIEEVITIEDFRIADWL